MKADGRIFVPSAFYLLLLSRPQLRGQVFFFCFFVFPTIVLRDTEEGI